VLVEHYYDVHPHFLFKGLNDKVIRAGDLGSELSFIDYSDFLLLFSFLQVFDAVAQFLQVHIQGIFDRFVRGETNTVSEAVSEIRSLKHNIVIALGLYFHPSGGILHGKSKLFTRKYFVIFRQGDGRNNKDKNYSKYGDL
jgi:hypothetical protein